MTSPNVQTDPSDPMVAPKAFTPPLAGGAVEPAEATTDAVAEATGHQKDLATTDAIRAQLGQAVPASPLAVPALSKYTTTTEVTDLPEGLKQKGFAVHVMEIRDRKGLMGDEAALRALIPPSVKLYSMFSKTEMLPKNSDLMMKNLSKH
ncbi:hypothetical protein COY07_00745 [Candidatus Peregrinibacteria bacterium CG_4_10_14_0_2_um_filter_43_11]|nr:MAG: hypothetical protein COY07_00745 [Candidatus Peregrinibacteria bacterium CG_4_10_14_0_2_um_filter_43_11]